MALGEPFKIGTKSSLLYLNIYNGHFATSHSHTNYYIDITSHKSSIREAMAVAKALAEEYKSSTLVDTILCLDGTEVIGACLARELTRTDSFSVNSGGDAFVLTPEHTTGSQLFFRDNVAPMVTGKSVLILAASVVTGFTAKSAIEAVNYYGGRVVGVASLFATIDECVGVPVVSVFDPNDLPGYSTNLSIDCPLCKQGKKIDALVNNFGISML